MENETYAWTDTMCLWVFGVWNNIHLLNLCKYNSFVTPSPKKFDHCAVHSFIVSHLSFDGRRKMLCHLLIGYIQPYKKVLPAIQKIDYITFNFRNEWIYVAGFSWFLTVSLKKKSGYTHKYFFVKLSKGLQISCFQ